MSALRVMTAQPINKIKSWKRRCHEKLHHYSDTKKLIREATNAEPGGCSETLKREIAVACEDVASREEVFSQLWKRLSGHSAVWWHVWKALDIWEFLLKKKTEGVANELALHRPEILDLLNYDHAKSNIKGEDGNAMTREKVKTLLALINDGKESDLGVGKTNQCVEGIVLLPKKDLLASPKKANEGTTKPLPLENALATSTSSIRPSNSATVDSAAVPYLNQVGGCAKKADILTALSVVSFVAFTFLIFSCA